MSVRHTRRCIVLFLVLTLIAAPGAGPLAGQPAGHVVISEVYGGGGNSGSTYTHDFIELYNPTSADVVMPGWSVQYQSGSGAGAFTAIAKFSGTIRSHRFFLIQANPGSGGTTPLPTPDAVAGVTLAAASGKIALSADTLAVSGPGSPGVVDFAGYGTSNLFEGSGPAAAPSNSASIERKASASSDAASMGPGGADELSGNGRDSDDNTGDFIRRDPDPQNDAAGPEAPGETLGLTAVYAGRWNLVSLPLAVADPSADAIFPDAQSPLYAYRSGYVGESTAVRGTGYWVRFAEAETVSFNGTPAGPDTVELSPGWNLVGAASSPLGAAEIPQLPGGHITTGFYGYDGGYSLADTLYPGHAYWVRSTTGGKIVLSAGASAVGITFFHDGEEDLPPPPPGVRESPGEFPGVSDPERATVAGVWPNPFNPVTRVDFSLPAAGPVRIEIFDLSGRRVALLADGPMTAGNHSVEWNARRDDGRGVAAGMYLLRLRAGRSVVGRTLLYLP